VERCTELVATGAKSGDSAREPSGEPSGAHGSGIAIKQEDSAAGEGITSTTGHVVHRQGNCTRSHAPLFMCVHALHARSPQPVFGQQLRSGLLWIFSLSVFEIVGSNISSHPHLMRTLTI
jgi:hypothetical protein